VHTLTDSPETSTTANEVIANTGLQIVHDDGDSKLW
jgi:hypothetical protein